MPTLLQNQRATRRLRRPNWPSRLHSRGEVQRGAAPASGSSAPGAPSSLPARKSRQASKSARDELGHRAGVADQLESHAFALVAGARHADQLLAKHVKRCSHHTERLDPAGPGSSGRDRRTSQLSGSCREQDPARHSTAAMARTAHALQAARHAAGGADLDHQIRRADIDAELETRAGDDRSHLSCRAGTIRLRAGAGHPGPSGGRQRPVPARKQAPAPAASHASASRRTHGCWRR